MSTVERAVEKVKKLSASQARELLGWLDKQQGNGKPVKKRRQPWWRQGTAEERKEKHRAWLRSIRGKTDWEIPRMPDEFVNPDKFRL